MAYLIYGIYFVSFVATALTNENTELFNAVKKAEKYLRDKHVIAEIGSLFLKQKLTPELFDEKDIPKNDAFAKLFGADYAIKNFSLSRTIDSALILRDIPMLRPLNNYFYTLPTEHRTNVFDPWDDVLIKTLYCDSTGFDDLDFSILTTIRDGRGGYYDTHQLLGLFMLAENGCYDNKKIDSKKHFIVDNIITALNNDHIFSDLYAERVACLYWARAGHRVRPEWIRVIKDAQRADGGWADLGLKNSSSHPTGLAAISIKYFLDKDKADEPRFYKP